MLSCAKAEVLRHDCRVPYVGRARDHSTVALSWMLLMWTAAQTVSFFPDNATRLASELGIWDVNRGD
jgi:hypothetical protein